MLEFGMCLSESCLSLSVTIFVLFNANAIAAFFLMSSLFSILPTVTSLAQDPATWEC